MKKSLTIESQGRNKFIDTPPVHFSTFSDTTITRLNPQGDFGVVMVLDQNFYDRYQMTYLNYFRLKLNDQTLSIDCRFV